MFLCPLILLTPSGYLSAVTREAEYALRAQRPVFCARGEVASADTGRAWLRLDEDAGHSAPQ